MKLKEYWDSLETEAERTAFAHSCDSAYSYMRMVAYGYGNKTAGIELAIKIEAATGGKVPVEETRPDVAWDVIRPSPANVHKAA